MALNCTTQAAFWGDLWGEGLGEGLPFVPGGDLPASDLFDLFCVCGPATIHVDGFLEVSVTPGDVDHNYNDPGQGTYVLKSDDGVRAGLFFNVAIPPSVSLEIIVRVDDLPADLATNERHFYFGIYDDTLASAGLFLSQSGIGFSRSYDDAPLILPDSQGLVLPGGTYVFRIVIDQDTSSTFIYIEEESIAKISGLKLKYVLPLLDMQGAPAQVEGVYLSSLGTALNPTIFTLDAVCLASDPLVDNFPPVANPGQDMALPEGNVIQLDGSKSSDPEGSVLTYEWRVIDVPIESLEAQSGVDGTTLASVSGFVDKLYSSHAASGGPEEFFPQIGDVILFEGIPASYLSTGVDGNGPYFEIESELFPEALTNRGFRIISQSRMGNANKMLARYLPDVPGYYRFDLRVRDAALASTRSPVLVNVLRNDVARGIVPDASFLWQYLSDTWALVDDRERIEAVWSSLIQVIGSEALRLWQAGANSSLRTIPRTIQRRWLNYDLLLREPYPELAKVRSVWTGITSEAVGLSGLALSGTLLLSIPGEPDLTPIPLVPSTSLMTPARVAAYLQAELRKVRSSFTVTSWKVSPTESRININAPFPFSSVTGTTVLFSPGLLNESLGGSGAERLSARSLRVGVSLQGTGLVAGDLLALGTPSGSVVVSVLSTQDVQGDTHLYQRIATQEDLPVAMDGSWTILTSMTSPQVNFWSGGVSVADRCVVEAGGAEGGTYYLADVIGVSASRPFVLGILTENLFHEAAAAAKGEVRFWGVYREKLMPIELGVQSIPTLQENPWENNQTKILVEGYDYVLKNLRRGRFIEFATRGGEGFQDPVPRLWAEETFLDNSDTIEANFGHAVSLTRARLEEGITNLDYLSAVRGLWFAHMKGPRIGNLRIASQILLGLPFAEEPGVIADIDTSYSPTQGRIVIQDKRSETMLRTYTYPKALSLEINPATGKLYAAGDKVEQFAPLVEGVAVLDWVKDPTWFRPFVAQGALREVEKLHTFLVRVDLEAFGLTALSFVDEFLRRVKPARTKPLFMVRMSGLSQDTVDVTDSISMQGFLKLYMSPYTKAFSYPDSDDPNVGLHAGSAAMFDQPDASPGGVGATPHSPLFPGAVTAAFDTDTNPANAYPSTEPDFEQGWGFDLQVMGPSNSISAKLIIDYDGLDPMTLFEDIADAASQPVLQNESLTYSRTWVPPFKDLGTQVWGPLSPVGTVTVTYAQVRLQGVPVVGGQTYFVRVFRNGLQILEFEITHASEAQVVLDYGPSPAPLPLTGGPFTILSTDEVKVGIFADTGEQVPYPLKFVSVILGEGVSWDPLGPALPAGSYYTHRTL
jgi:hypothetical protein